MKVWRQIPIDQVNLVLPASGGGNYAIGSGVVVAGYGNDIKGAGVVVAGQGNTVNMGEGCLVNGVDAVIPEGSPYRRAFNNMDRESTPYRTNCSQWQMSNMDPLFYGNDDTQYFELYHAARTLHESNPQKTLRFGENSLVGISMKVVCLVVFPGKGTLERAVGTVNGWVDLRNGTSLFDRFRNVVAYNGLNNGSMSILDYGTLSAQVYGSEEFVLSIELGYLGAYATSIGFSQPEDLQRFDIEIYFNCWVDSYELMGIPSVL